MAAIMPYHDMPCIDPTHFYDCYLLSCLLTKLSSVAKLVMQPFAYIALSFSLYVFLEKAHQPIYARVKGMEEAMKV